jgi:hypothetical protein
MFVKKYGESDYFVEMKIVILAIILIFQYWFYYKKIFERAVNDRNFSFGDNFLFSSPTNWC